MKNNFRKMLVFHVFCLIFAFAVSAQIKTGGYKTISVTDAGAKAAADFAVETKTEELETGFELLAIEKAESQSVAGTNYRLCLKLDIASAEEKPDDTSFFVQTVVFKNLKKEHKITSWTELEEGCD